MSHDSGGGDRGHQRRGWSRPVRAALVVLLAVVVLAVLFTQVFPRVERMLDTPTVGASAVAVDGRR